MQRRLQHFWLTIIALLAVPGLAACSQASAVVETSHEEPAKVEAIEGSDLSRVILTEKAAQRLGIQTEPAREEPINGAPRLVIPYGALLYDPQGQTWTYTNPEALTFVREAVAVERIDADLVILTEGPGAGTPVVTVGVSELYGAELGVGH